MNSTRFTFIRGIDGRCVGCLAYRINDRAGTALAALEYAVSTHNPKDQYDRSLARFVAEGRMEKHPRRVTFNPRLPPSLDILLRAACEDLLASDPPMVENGLLSSCPVPNRLRRALRLRLNYLDYLAQREAKAKQVKRAKRAAAPRPDVFSSPDFLAEPDKYPRYNFHQEV